MPLAPEPRAVPACSLGDPTTGPQPVCPVCGHRGPLVWIHGEGRCGRCGTVLDTCCSGAPLDGFEE
ncbi:MAG: hypothetical protein K6T74_13455 [Geminicoccaceae bacterium]|nr:hypothetical protein [Geminicoccaceae bacterium]